MSMNRGPERAWRIKLQVRKLGQRFILEYKTCLTLRVTMDLLKTSRDQILKAVRNKIGIKQ